MKQKSGLRKLFVYIHMVFLNFMYSKDILMQENIRVFSPVSSYKKTDRITEIKCLQVFALTSGGPIFLI